MKIVLDQTEVTSIIEKHISKLFNTSGMDIQLTKDGAELTTKLTETILETLEDKGTDISKEEIKSEELPPRENFNSIFQNKR